MHNGILYSSLKLFVEERQFDGDLKMICLWQLWCHGGLLLLTTIISAGFCLPRVSSFTPASKYDQRPHGRPVSVLLFATVEEHSVQKVAVDDNRPHKDRAKETRKARRLNHGFRHLYRHPAGTTPSIRSEDMSARDYLKYHGGYTDQQIDNLHEGFPPLLDLDVPKHLIPKMRFLKETLLELPSATEVLPEDIRTSLPPQYYGSRLERIIAPRHAFLVHMKLPHGKDLLQDASHRGATMFGNTSSSSNTISLSRWQDFLKSCRNTKQFAALCNRWAREQQQQQQQQQQDSSRNPQQSFTSSITPKQIEAFDVLFGRGLMAAARNELCQSGNDPVPIDHINITSGEMMDLLIQHGANPLERDNRGVSLLHWASGSGNLGGVQALLPSFLHDNHTIGNDTKTIDNIGFFVPAERDGSTPLHWASAGANSREFGTGGHLEVCQYILSQAPSAKSARHLVNQLTRDGNSALMWAAWSGTLETVKFLIRNRADPSGSNRNGCTLAHWASSGGNLEVCQYLANTVGVDFTAANHGGNTPLTHAVAFRRKEVVEWLRREIVDKDDDCAAASLALEFVDWADGQDEARQEVLNLFEDWYV